MSDKLISGLPAASSVGSTDLFEIEQGGTSKKAAASLFAAAAVPAGNVAIGTGTNVGDSGVAMVDLALTANVPSAISDISVPDRSVLRGSLDYTNSGGDIATVTTAGTATLEPGKIYYGSIGAATTIAFSPAMTQADPPTVLYLVTTGQPWTLTYPAAVRNDANGSTTTASVTSNKYIIVEFVKTAAGNIRMLDNITDQTAATVSDTAYDATTWDAVTATAPSKNAVRDKVEAMISDTAYDATTWNAVTTVAPSKNAVRDQLETMLTTVAALPTASSTTTFTNKRITKRLGTTASSATPSIDSDSYDVYTITALAAAITSLTITGTPTEGQSLLLQIKDDGTNRALAFGTGSCAFSSDLAAPTTTTTGKWQEYSFLYRVALTKWVMTGKLENIA